MSRKLRAVVLSVCLTAVAVIAPTHPAFAVTYEPAPAFCSPTVVHDYLAPLKRMPKLHTPAATGEVGFGPASLRLQPLPSLLVGEGDVGYKLFQARLAPAAHPDWDVTTTLSRVDWRGRTVEVLDRARRKVTTLNRARGAGVRFPVGDEPAPYRVTAVFRTKSGRKLGGYGFYFRVVAPTGEARLGLNASSYRPGQTVFGRIENLGATATTYGVSYAIERLDPTGWIKAPESPSGPVIMIALGTPPGLTSSTCFSFWVPPEMLPGRYRMVKEVDFRTESASLPRQNSAVLSAEFDVLP